MVADLGMGLRTQAVELGLVTQPCSSEGVRVNAA